MNDETTITAQVNTLVEALAALPVHDGVVYRGADETCVFRRPGQVVITRLLTDCSVDPRVATTNGATREMYCIDTRSGRDLTVLSRDPDELQVTLLPYTPLVLARSVVIDGSLVHLVLELAPEELAAPDQEEVARRVDELGRVAAAHLAEVRTWAPLELSRPGHFIGDIE